MYPSTACSRIRPPPVSFVVLFLLLCASTIRTVTSDVVSDKSQVSMAFVPKFDNLVPFDQAISGANAAKNELSPNVGTLEYVAPPSADGSAEAQIDIVQRATMTDFSTILLSNNAGDDIEPSCVEAQEAGVDVVTWDSPIPGGTEGGEDVFIAQVDFDETGMIMAEMAYSILEGNGQFAILSASRRAANQNAWIQAMEKAMSDDPLRYGLLELLTVAYGDDDDSLSFAEANRLMDEYPGMQLIMAPTTIAISAAARAVTERGLCDTIKVSGLGIPGEMLDYTNSGCSPVFALWSFVDLGYLTYYAAYALATGDLAVADGETFQAGRLGEFTIERDPTRPDVEAYRVVMGGFTLYDKNNIEQAVFFDAVQGDGGQESFEERYMSKYKKKALSIIPKVTGMISCIASGYVIWHVLRHKKRRALTKNRVLVGISVHDMISSFFGFFLSTWPIPADTWLVWGATGTVQTCTMQGFFFQGGISAAPLYHASLSTVYVLNIVYEFSNERIARKAEPWLHGIPILFAWGTAIAGLPLKLYNAADRVGFFCWIAEYPPYCSLRGTCERGENADIYRYAFLFAWVFVGFAYMAICMILIYRKVLSVEKANDKWTDASGLRRHRSKSSLVRQQGIRYVAAFFFPWVFGITAGIMQHMSYADLEMSRKYDDAITALSLVNAIVLPLKGFFTFLAYTRPTRKPKAATHSKVTRDSNEEVTEQRRVASLFPVHVKHVLTKSSMTRAANHESATGSNVGSTARQQVDFAQEEEKHSEEECKDEASVINGEEEGKITPQEGAYLDEDDTLKR